MKKTILICGATGFIGQNLLDYYYQYRDLYNIRATYFGKSIIEKYKDIEWKYTDLRNPEYIKKAIENVSIILQFAATTSGANDIVNRPYIHVTDNAVMNSYLLRECYEQGVKHFVFPSCTVMYQPSDKPLKETDFNGNDEIYNAYFGVGNTKVYIEKMCEFYSRLGKTKHTVIRHSNCFSEDTEVLTVDGIKNIKNINIGDDVYTLNPKTLKMEKSKVIFCVNKITDRFININGRSIDWKVTEDHNLFLSDFNPEFKFIKAKDLLYKNKFQKYIANTQAIFTGNEPERINIIPYIKSGFIIKARNKTSSSNRKLINLGFKKVWSKNGISYNNITENINIHEIVKIDGYNFCIKDSYNSKFEYEVEWKFEPFLKLLAWYITEGNVIYCSKRSSQIFISQSEKNKTYREEIINILKELHLKPQISKSAISFNSNIFGAFVRKHNILYSNNKNIPDFIFDLSYKYRTIFFNTLMKGDGHKSYKKYSTVSSKLCHQMIVLSLSLGINVSYRKEKNIYRILFRHAKGKNKNTCIKNNNITEIYNENKKEMSYCITTDKNHIIYAGRNGKLGWIGQCYGPHDKFDLERSHVFGATITKVMTNTTGEMNVWGTGEGGRDLLYVEDLVNFIDLAINNQESNYELFNVGFGKAIKIIDLINKIIENSGREIKIKHDLSKPSIPTSLCLGCSKAKNELGWMPKIDIDEGIKRTLAWYERNFMGNVTEKGD